MIAAAHAHVRDMAVGGAAVVESAGPEPTAAENLAAGPFTPALYSSGPLPLVPAQTVGGGEVLVEISVTRAGEVRSVTPLRTTPPFTPAVVDAVGVWRFIPAEAARSVTLRERVDSKVLVAAVFRPPTLLNAPVLGEPPKDVATASAEIPFPTATTVPSFPPRALAGGIVLVEVRVDPSGRVTDAAVIRSAPSFDEPALDAARQWTFRPARIDGVAVNSSAYVIFAFRQPVT